MSMYTPVRHRKYSPHSPINYSTVKPRDSPILSTATPTKRTPSPYLPGRSSSILGQTIRASDFFKGRLLGQNQLGPVFAVKHKRSGLAFALKVIKKEAGKQQAITDYLKQVHKHSQAADGSSLFLKHYGMFDDRQKICVLSELGLHPTLKALAEHHALTLPDVRVFARLIIESLVELEEQKLGFSFDSEDILFNNGCLKFTRPREMPPDYLKAGLLVYNLLFVVRQVDERDLKEGWDFIERVCKGEQKPQSLVQHAFLVIR